MSAREGSQHETHIQRMMARYGFSQETCEIIEQENLLPAGLINRLHVCFPQHSGFNEDAPFLFTDKDVYAGLDGFREIISVLERNGIHIGHIVERELFIEIYRFMTTRHALNTINWSKFETDSMFRLIFPQPGMIKDKEVIRAYSKGSDVERRAMVREYITHCTNPHDGKQLLNRPWYRDEQGTVVLVQGSQHKYPPCQLIFDHYTQNCFAFCTYCFRHAQVRGDEDMFLQRHPEQIHAYLHQHPEVSDILITGGDAGFIPCERFASYVLPILEDPRLRHIRTVRLGTRMLSYSPERVLNRRYDRMLDLFERLYDNGIQVFLNLHVSTPRELLNPATIAAIRRLKRRNVLLKNQSPIMNNISLFTGPDGKVDIERSAQHWIDLGHILAMLSVGFHSMYGARPTGEHHYFAAPLADIDKVFARIYRELPSISRPSRYITQTSSAGKISLLGTAEINGEKVFVLKFNEGRNMHWMDRVFFARYDEHETVTERLRPYGADRFFYEQELIEIEERLHHEILTALEEDRAAKGAHGLVDSWDQ